MKLLHGMVVVAAVAVGVSGCVVHVRGNGNGGVNANDNPYARGWDKLGERAVDFNVDKDSIVVTGNEGTFRAIGIQVTGAPVDMYDIRVTFGDGEVFSPNVRQNFDRGSWSRSIDLPGNRRVIRRVDFVYRTSQRGRGRATVHLFGQR